MSEFVTLYDRREREEVVQSTQEYFWALTKLITLHREKVRRLEADLGQLLREAASDGIAELKLFHPDDIEAAGSSDVRPLFNDRS